MGRAASETVLTYRWSLPATAARRRRQSLPKLCRPLERRQGRRRRCSLNPGGQWSDLGLLSVSNVGQSLGAAVAKPETLVQPIAHCCRGLQPWCRGEPKNLPRRRKRKGWKHSGFAHFDSRVQSLGIDISESVSIKIVAPELFERLSLRNLNLRNKDQFPEP